VRCSRRAALLGLGLAGLAGCGDLPRPFQPDDKATENPLLRLAGSAGVVVMPLSGIDDDDAATGFAAALAAALRDADIVAHNGAGTRASKVLASYLDREAGRLTLWLTEGDGTEIGTFETGLGAAEALRDTPQRKRLLRDLAETVAQGIDPTGARVAPVPKLRLARVAGLPPGQSEALERAMAFWLRRARFEIAEQPDRDQLVLAGAIGFRERPRDLVEVDVLWRMLGADGAELGRLQQRNEVPTAALQRGWGEIAGAIAESAAPGIVDLASRAPRARGR
jgi:hypothetical protein